MWHLLASKVCVWGGAFSYLDQADVAPFIRCRRPTSRFAAAAAAAAAGLRECALPAAAAAQIGCVQVQILPRVCHVPQTQTQHPQIGIGLPLLLLLPLLLQGRRREQQQPPPGALLRGGAAGSQNLPGVVLQKERNSRDSVSRGDLNV
jgi:hypothetical protein